MLPTDEDSESGSSSSSTSSSSMLNWPTIEEFTTDSGLICIYDFIATWEYEEDWLYAVDFLFGQSDECSDFYQYEVKIFIYLLTYNNSYKFDLQLNSVISNTIMIIK